jgi:deoxycytidine triphosphate deaminase
MSHALAGWIDNGFKGVLTLELKNYSRFNKIPIYPTMRVGQLILEKTNTPEKSYSGKYAGHNMVKGYLK